eukprot:TRINITY_DN11701_c0_g1_i1.p1 TRINITY_DN11701_c0_g1~~TRINITY_DN11701_c0_g1_i1.p1  ORF type:complete len:373 (-),score=27.27 TRINITY_DN11701_c0_g1_i1:123-1241(-)
MEQNNLKKYRVLGVGLAIIDYIASVDHYPEPDEKMRSQSLECTGGGNCYNALSTLSSMGIHTQIVSKVGADPHGKKVLELCKMKNIDTQHIVVDAHMNTAFSFVIADVAHGTRTIVHNPGNELNVENMIDSSLLDNIDIIYLDGRFTKAALRVAELARGRNSTIPLLLDCERARSEEFEELRRQAQYLIASLNYIKLFMEDQTSTQGSDPDREVKALERLLTDSNGATWTVLTLGSRGSLSLHKLTEDLAATKQLAEWPGLETAIRSTKQMQLKDLVGGDNNVTSSEHYERLSKFLLEATKPYHWKNSYLIQYCPALHVETAGVGAGDKFIAGLAAGVLVKKNTADVPHLALGTLVAALGLANITVDWTKII